MTTSMTDTGVISGQKSGWSLVRKLGEGDAGEVYLVESLVESRSAILKRPARSVFTGEVRRQAEQIRTEGRILKALEDLLGKMPSIHISAPRLLDQSKAGSEFGDRFFIVIERAHGFDLSFLARSSRLGMDSNSDLEWNTVEKAFIEEIARQGQLPVRILLASLSAILTTFDVIHSAQVDTGSGSASGILWNDVKPDHIFWDPYHSAVTIIDWGNGRFLEEGGVTRDMRHTVAGDRRQFLDEMGRFLAQSSPELYARLNWPGTGHIYEDVNPLIEGLKDRVDSALAQSDRQLQEARSQEADLLQPSLDTGMDLSTLAAVHQRIVALGEIPDFPAALRLVSRSAANLAAAGDMGGVRDLSAWAAGLPGAPVESLRLMTHLAQISTRQQGAVYTALVQAVQQAASGDWKEVLWHMLAALQNGPEPDWWNDVLPHVRKLAWDENTEYPRPLLNLRRLYLTLHSSAQQMEDQLVHYPDAERQSHLDNLLNLTQRLRAVIHNWVQIEPLPPHSMLVYSDLDPLINEVEVFLPGSGNELRQTMEPARQQVLTILEAWGRKEFISAARDLRSLLVLDPDRRRLLRAAQSLLDAPDWIQRLQAGPIPGESLLEFVTALEYEGRDLRNQIGPAGWLDGALEGLKSMRRGAWPGDLLAAQPILANEMPWLQRFERAERIQQIFHPNQPVLPPLASIQGIRETRFGPDSELAFTEPLDAWIPEARGSSARVYLGTYRSASGDQREAAIKIMRMDKADYALPLFHEEVQVLSVMQSVAGSYPHD